jgi:hypothetical protein
MEEMRQVISQLPKVPDVTRIPISRFMKQLSKPKRYSKMYNYIQEATARMILEGKKDIPTTQFILDHIINPTHNTVYGGIKGFKWNNGNEIVTSGESVMYRTDCLIRSVEEAYERINHPFYIQLYKNFIENNLVKVNASNKNDKELKTDSEVSEITNHPLSPPKISIP